MKLKTMLAATIAAGAGLAAVAAVDYTGTDYEPWSYSDGCVVWRATQNLFHTSTLADVTEEGTVGEEYVLGTADHPWQVFASNQSQYTSPGKTLVFDKPGYTASTDAQFSPFSLGGMKVDALADETEGTPYELKSVTTAKRYMDFGVDDASTYFEFNKSFTIDRPNATRCYGDVTVNVADGATLNNTGEMWSESNGTLRYEGAGTVVVGGGVHINSSSTLDLSAETRPTIDGTVELLQGATIVLPDGTEPSAEAPFTVCSSNVTVSSYNYVKVGDSDPLLVVLSVDGGAITGYEETTLEQTFEKDYPTVVPSGFTYTFVGGTEEEPVALDSLSVRGTLKTQGYFTFTNYKSITLSTLDVESGTVSLDIDSALCGTLTVRADATFVNVHEADAVWYGGAFTANIYGTLSMGATRWSLGANNVVNLYEGCTVTGAGQGSNGALDWIDGITGNLNVHGSVTLEAAIRIRATTILNVNVDAGANEGLTLLGTTYGVGTIVKKGAGLIRFTTNPSYKITCENGAFTFGVDATPTITYSALPTASTSMWYAKQATWKGTVVIPATTNVNGSVSSLVNWGNENSTIVLKGLSGPSCYMANRNTVAATLQIDGDFVLNNGGSGQTVTFNKITGTGNLTLTGWTGCSSATYKINKFEGYTGTFTVHNAITREGGGTFTIEIGDIVNESTEPGTCVLPISNTAVENTTGTVVYNLDNATLNGEAADLVAKADGIYVAESSEGGVEPGAEAEYDTEEEANAAAMAVPAAVEEALTAAQLNQYKILFERKVTAPTTEGGKYVVTYVLTELAKTVIEGELAVELAKVDVAALATGESAQSVTIAAMPGLYFGVQSQSTLEAGAIVTTESSTLATGEEVTVTFPPADGSEAKFFWIFASPTDPAEATVTPSDSEPGDGEDQA